MTSRELGPGGWRELAVVFVAAVLLAVGLTYPLVLYLDNGGRLDVADGQFSVWNVAWVARTLVVDPLHVFDANIFYPHRRTLAFSENNLGAGILAIPAYWLTRNPLLAHNVVVLVAFTLSFVGMYYLVRYLVHDRRAAPISAICFAFCPYIFARLPHIQLLMTAGLPFSMLAFHRVVDRSTPARGAVLGLAMAGQAICCGYYGVFVLLMVGFATLFTATARARWTDTKLWASLAVAAVVAAAIVAPLFVPYIALQRIEGFSRTIDEAVRYSANWSAYLASSAYAHSWIRRSIPSWWEVLFPGILTSVSGLTAALIGWRSRYREIVFLYASMTILAVWVSFGPSARLYIVLYNALPPFALMRAPGRFGLIVAFGLAVLAGVALTLLLQRLKRPSLVAAAIAVVAIAELATPLRFPEADPLSPAYRTLAELPVGPVIEMPFFEQRIHFPRHALYMMNSTSHWMPLVNGYSDHIPPDFRANAPKISPFPYPTSFAMARRLGVRYAIFHMKMYDARTRAEVEGRLAEFSQYVRPLYVDADTRLYEITGFPP